MMSMMALKAEGIRINQVVGTISSPHLCVTPVDDAGHTT